MLPTNYEKFRLLLWKNWIIQWNNKVELFAELFLPVLFVSLLVFLRTNIDPKETESIIYTQMLPIDNLDLFRAFMSSPLTATPVKYHLAYSPNNTKVFDNIVKEAATNLKLTYSGHANSADLERTMINEIYLAGVEFDDALANTENYPKQFNYRVRFPSHLRTTMGTTLLWNTNKLFPDLDPLGPRNRAEDDGGIPVGYLREGFLPVQNEIAMAYIKQAAKNLKEPLPKLILQRYPYGNYTDDPFLVGMAGIMAVIILLSYLYPCSCQVKYISAEKEKQLKEVMKLIGVQNTLHWTAWFVKGFAMLGVSSLAMAIVLKVEWKNNLAVLTYSSFTAVLFLFLVFSVSSITLCFMLATFFSRANNAAAVACLVWIIMYLPTAYFQRNDASLLFRLFWSLLSNTAMGLAVRIIVIREGSTKGFQWSNMFEKTSPNDSLSIGHLIIMLCFSSVLYLCICLYIEQIHPGDFGVAQPWDFPFKKSYWQEKKVEVPKDDKDWDTLHMSPSENFEAEPLDKKIGVRVRHLAKTFGTKTVVKDVTMNMYESEITVLLGHNGAGKSTTISMLTGMFHPTAGTAIVNGYDIRTHLKEARETMGICPQHNILFDSMTVRDHLIFYSSLKGLKGETLENEVSRFMKVMELGNKENEVSSKLSGGMKRKLSVCAAFCGDTKVVLCDEPSSGMDPAARRALWDMMQAEKRGRTVLLTTHFMDEADILGDRIAIMSGGELKCCGTSFFLKQKFGSGYNLVCVKMANCDSQKVTDLLGKYIPNISPVSDVGTELSYQLPAQYLHVFQKMFQDLETKSEELGLNGFGVSVTPLEEVFMKVGAEEMENKTTSAETLVSKASEVQSEDVETLFSINKRQIQGSKLCLNQWISMFWKKYIYTIRNLMGLAILVFTPIVFTVLTIIVAGGVSSGSSGNLPSLGLNLLQYGGSVTVVETTAKVANGSLGQTISSKFREIIASYPSEHRFQHIGTRNFIDHILWVGSQYQFAVDMVFIAAATVDQGQIIAWLNNEPFHSAGVTVNLIHNAIARAVLEPGSRINANNAPLPHSQRTLFRLGTSNGQMGIELSSNMSFCMCFISALFSVFLIKERESRAKLLQFVGGINMMTFWVSHYVWDLLTFTLSALVAILTLAVYQKEGFSTFEELGRYFMILFLFASVALPLTYIASSFFQAPAAGFAILSITNVFFGNALFVTTFLLSYIMPDTEKLAFKMRKYLLAFPHYAMASSLNSLSINSQLKKTCGSLMDNISESDGCTLLPMCCRLEPYLSWDSPGVLREVVYLIFTGVTCTVLLILTENRVFARIKLYIQRRKKPEVIPSRRRSSMFYFDEDVENEKEAIKNMTKSEISERNLVIDRLTKVYGNHLTVNELSLQVKSAECFGLLGTNGAGKTTTFKMLTGDERVTAGDAYVKGLGIKTDMKSVCQEIGYCPQFDALLDEFTGGETLKIFCLLRGIPAEMIPHVSQELAKSFGFQKHFDKQVGSYSGGNKRKLSAALAFIGRPAVVYLDEPTSSMDPASRRYMWDVVCLMRDGGEAIVLTSHSMDECEALCTRLAIMVNGSLKCIGSTQHLKNKFAKGFILKFKLTKASMIDELKTQNMEKAMQVIEKEFPEAKLQEELEGIFTYYIPVAKLSWSIIFNVVESHKDELNIEDYSISQTTLEEIFLQFARRQWEDPLAN